MEDTAVYKNLLEESREPQKPSHSPPPRLLLSAVLLLITNPSQEAFIQFLNRSLFLNRNEYLSREDLESQWSLVISVFFWGCTAGAFLIRVLSEKFGRKSSLQRTSALIYAISRFILGFGITISLGTAPMFITECSPKRCRGVASLASGILLQIAIVTGAILAMPHLFGNVDEWYKLYGFEMVITTAVMLLVPIIHDSPGHLHSRGLNAECEQSLRFYHDIDGESLRMALKQLDEDASQGDGAQIGLISIWKDPMARRGTLVGSVVMLSMVMSAINAFSFEILLSTGLSISQASYGNVAICVMNVLGILTSSMIIDRFGRRMLLLSTYSLLAATNLAISALMYGFEHEKVLTVLLLYFFLPETKGKTVTEIQRDWAHLPKPRSSKALLLTEKV
ncbi:unnamed protein product [Nippostrongylus brasiliensis]|uniref:Glucose transporter type 1 (inferred by orthology to a D. melanogaster protein) n=1 Tax=Nippostrongylus brasiliensis TaxID=27835 RepID=A0A158R1B6_NIPBR|nr:unnamed protein product [Nippostrongylus brasiliensis]